MCVCVLAKVMGREREWRTCWWAITKLQRNKAMEVNNSKNV